MPNRSLLAAAAAVVLGVSACGGSAADTTAPSSDGGDLDGTLTVFAAASLTDVFTALGDQLEEQHPQLDVRFSFAGSSALATQLGQGAPADVFAAADEAQMARVQDAGLVEEPAVFAENRLVLVVPPADPAGLRLPKGVAGAPSLADVLTSDVTLAVCAEEVPCGAAAAAVLAAAGSPATPDTYEEDVRAVLTKVELGEVDAGLVYVSDAAAAGDQVVALGFREAEQAVNRYPVAVLTDAPNPDAARAFSELVRSPAGQRALHDAGFPTS
ncbi:molybdate ABC transporter substrate-binding protein [Modestobacter sp. SSW1-42]|uniref:molybdate ABC transporter substrate-binding protein n=1 Tax=Modestobacter sp. SSW1-42 TaxID=596372 RepID=UPI00398812C1